MDTWQRRTLYYLLGLVTIILAYALAYDYGMRVYEGDPGTFLHSLQIVVETFTTTGFGSDAPWTSREMNLLVIVMDLTGVLLIFMALPVLVFPLFEQALSTSAPASVQRELRDHVVVCTYSPRGEALIAELDSWDVEYVVVEPDRDAADGLFEDGYTVIHQDPETVEGLERANLSTARALVADASDQVNTSTVLTAREVAEDVKTISVVEEPDRARYHRLAGADEVISPRRLLGESLATKVTTGISTELGDAIDVGEDFEIAELPIHRGSDLAGRTLQESGLRERAGVNVIGAWFSGQFQSPPSPDATFDSGTILLVSGQEEQLERLKDMTIGDVRQYRQGKTIVAGFGEVGATVADALESAEIHHTVFDREDKPGVDVVGDVTDPADLRAAGIEDARTIILALPDDTVSEYATLVVRDANRTVEIVARAEETENVQKVFRAGADYVLSLASVSGRMLASTILEDEEVMSLDKQVQVVRTRAPRLVGKTLGEADVRSLTGCTVVGVEREGTVVTDTGADFRIESGDELIVAGTDAGTNRFVELMS